MITQISFTADETLKNKALEKAKREGITLKALLTHAMKSFLEGKLAFNLVSTQEEPETEELIFTDKEINQKAARLSKMFKPRLQELIAKEVDRNLKKQAASAIKTKKSDLINIKYR